jgi:uncharacterized membrane protein YphA (DoxX/SURF4 family)
VGCVLQRLFSTFPSGWPGLGLLLLRFSLGVALIAFAIASPPGNSAEPIALARNLIAAAGGIFLLAGLWTPVMGALVTLDQVWMACLRGSVRREDTWIHIFLAIVAASVAMLGPGALSIDACLFGRKRFEIDRSKG